MERATKRLAKEKLVALKAAEADPKGRGSLDDVDESSSLDDADPLRFIGLDYADENASVQSSSASEARTCRCSRPKKRNKQLNEKVRLVRFIVALAYTSTQLDTNTTSISIFRH
jgi:hypothetical protein